MCKKYYSKFLIKTKTIGSNNTIASMCENFQPDTTSIFLKFTFSWSGRKWKISEKWQKLIKMGQKSQKGAKVIFYISKGRNNIDYMYIPKFRVLGWNRIRGYFGPWLSPFWPPQMVIFAWRFTRFLKKYLEFLQFAKSSETVGKNFYRIRLSCIFYRRPPLPP